MTKFVNATSPSTRWNMETILVSLKKGMFVVVHLRSTLSLQHWAEPPQNDNFERNGKIGAFSRLRNEPIEMKFTR